MPNGKDIIQTGSFELDGCNQEFDHSMSLWKVKQEQQSGDYYLLMAESEEDFQDQFAVSMFKIVHLNKDYLIIRSPYFDGGDTTTEGYVQLKRTQVMF